MDFCIIASKTLIDKTDHSDATRPKKYQRRVLATVAPTGKLISLKDFIHIFEVRV